MERDLKGLLSIEFVFVDSRGWNIHVDVVRSNKLHPTEEAAITGVFDSHMKVLHATVKQRLRFLELVKLSDELEWIDAHDAHWAGLGAVRYIPKFFRTPKTPPSTTLPNGTVNGDQGADTSTNELANGPAKAQPSTDDRQIAEASGNIDHLNAKIVDKLKAVDSAFSLGKNFLHTHIRNIYRGLEYVR